MAAPCMASLLSFLSVPQRVEVMRVAPAWRKAVQQPHLWSDTEWRCQRGRADSEFSACPVWLRGLLGGLTLSCDRLMQLDLLRDGARVTALTLSEASDSHTPELDGLTLRRALQRLRLRTLNVCGSPPQQLLDALFGSAESLASIVPGDPSTHPAVWSWTDTLEALRVCDDKGLSFGACLTAMAGRQWPELRGVELDIPSALRRILR